MTDKMKKTRNALMAFLLGALSMSNALADDIEIYVGGNSSIAGVQPNILFVLDTSGSMDTQVETQVPYDPLTVYPGDCTAGNIYISDDNNPTCDSDAPSWCEWWWCGGGDDPAQAVPASLFVCDAANSVLTTTGFYEDRFAQWRERNDPDDSEWEDDVDENDRITECRDDYGVHGDDTTNVFPVEGENGPFSADDNDDINWSQYDVYTAYSANYLNWMNDDTTKTVQTRLEIMQDVITDVLASISNVNVGLMRFDSGAEGGMVIHEVANLSDARSALQAQVNAMTANGNTPLAETLYEAGLYYMGDNVDYGLDSSPQVSVASSRDGNTYISPIEFQCQKNFIVYLTDGEPTSDGSADDKIEDLPGNGASCSFYGSNDCMDEMSAYLYEKDLSGSLAGTQNVITYTVGFFSDQALLESAATKGGGTYYTADDTASLSNALTNIIAEVLSINSTFTAPAVSVNAFNRTVHLDQLFFTIFKPSDRPHWNGNLKRFDLGTPSSGGDVQILDAADNPAVDPNTGFFKDSAVSFWTNADQSPDGGEAVLGGAAGDLALPRDVYTYTGSSALLSSDATNAFHEDNALITKSALGIASATDADRINLIQWARGVDVNDDDDDGSFTDIRRVMGDPLHSKPVVVTYGGDATTPDFTVFMSTNDGFLHAINGQTGTEHFAFIPQQRWSNLNTLYVNDAGSNSKIYGLDSPITAWINDVDEDGTIESGDHVYLYFGERRGGGNYYALDVTDREAPEFLWQISDATAGYGELGQTWSQPRVARINVGGTVKDVLIFGGGYDPDQDTGDSYSVDDEGRAIYIADALTGALIWSAGPTGSGADLILADLKNSIPAELRVVDVNGDGLEDRIYAGDMGGRIFRFDILNGNAATSLVSGGKIASLGAGDLATPTDADNRKFFYPPDASLIVDEVNGNYINLAVGSGNQSDPLGTSTQDRFFSIHDPNVLNVPTSYDYDITTTDLFDATSNIIGQGTADERSAAITLLDSKEGWYINLVNTSSNANEGEKVLAEATTIQGTIFFTTFTPVASAQSSGCAPSQGLARAYVVNVEDATPVYNLDGFGGEEDLTRTDRSTNLIRGGIPPEVTILFPESNDGKPIGLVGPEKLPVDISNTPVRTYWYEAGTDTE